MQRHKIVGKASVGLLLFLPLVAVGVALALMLSWGHQGAQQAAADASSDIEFSMSAPGCSTISLTEKDSCKFSVGDSFQVTLSFDAHAAHHPVATNNQMVAVWGGAISGPDLNTGKALTNPAPPGCDIPVAAPGVLGKNSLGVGCATLFSPTIATGALGIADFNCDSAGTGSITLLNSNVATLVTDAALQPHFEDNAVDQLNITCNPPNGQININVVDAGDQGKKLSDSCWLISTSIATGLSPPNDFLNKPVDVVSDNNAKNTCDNLGPIKSDLSDNDAGAVGSLNINISPALRIAFGDVYHIQQIQAGSSPANPDIVYNLDSTKYTCVLTPLVGPKPDGSTGCAFFDGPIGPAPTAGVGTLNVKNVRKNGIATINFSAKGALDPDLLNGLCVVAPVLLGAVCDGDANDLDGAEDGSIRLSLIPFVHLFGATTVKVAGVFELDPTQQPGDGDQSQFCDLAASQKCVITFSYRSQVGDINVTINEVNRKGQTFNDPSGDPQLVPGACINVEPGKPGPEADLVCDGDPNDKDTDPGEIRYNGVPVGNHTVTAKAKGFESRTGPVVVAVPAGAKVSTKINLEFVGIPAVFGMNGAPQNLWLTNQNPDTCNNSADKATKLVVGASAPQTRIPKETINDKDGVITPDKTPQVVAGAEISFLLKDSLANGEVACIEVEAGDYWRDAAGNLISSCTITSSGDKQKIDVFCATKKQDLPLLGDLKDMFRITVKVNPVVYSLFRATQDNGTLVQVLALNCNLTDQLGHPIANQQCPDGDITVRQLEGDVNRDCKVDIIDQQLLAFRWNTDINDNIFSQTYDLVDDGTSQINIKDVQFTFGRTGSKCNSQNALDEVGDSQPPQLPLTKK